MLGQADEPAVGGVVGHVRAADRAGAQRAVGELGHHIPDHVGHGDVARGRLPRWWPRASVGPGGCRGCPPAVLTFAFDLDFRF